MGSSQSSNSGDFEKVLAYCPYFDANRPIQDQEWMLFKQEHLAKILNGDFPDIFEDEAVEHVWIYSCDLRSAEGARIGSMALASVATVAGVLTLIPGISKTIKINKHCLPMHMHCIFCNLNPVDAAALPVAAVAGIGAGLSAGTVPRLNHQFVMFKTEKWLYVLSKDTKGCVCFRAKHSYQDVLLKVQQQYDTAERRFQSDPFPRPWKDAKGTNKFIVSLTLHSNCYLDLSGKVRLFDMIRWMEKESVIEKEYNWARANCQGFAQSFFDFLTTRQTQ